MLLPKLIVATLLIRDINQWNDIPWYPRGLGKVVRNLLSSAYNTSPVTPVSTFIGIVNLRTLCRDVEMSSGAKYKRGI